MSDKIADYLKLYQWIKIIACMKKRNFRMLWISFSKKGIIPTFLSADFGMV